MFLKRFLLIALIVFGTFLHFYNLNWGAPFYFHPDERQNIVYTIQSSTSPLMWDQKNFDTGTFPLIIIKNTYALFMLVNPSLPANNFTNILFLARFYSSSFTILCSVLLFFIGKKIKDTTTGIIAFSLSFFCTGFLQFSHFATIEVWEAFFFLCLLYLTLLLYEKVSYKTSLLLGATFSIALATKILTILLLPVLLSPYLFAFYKKKRFSSEIIFSVLIFLFSAGIVAVFLMPQVFIDFSAVYQSLHFESGVALGTLPIFFTQEFYQTIPIVFQLVHVFPFLLNPLNSILLLISCCWALGVGIQKKYTPYLVLVVFFFILFLSQSYFFVKWTRYMIPAIPFAILLISLFVSFLYKKIKRYSLRGAQTLIVGIILLTCCFGTFYTITVFFNPDTRMAAASWMTSHIPPSSTILSEPYDIGLTAMQALYPHITTIDIYALDNPSFTPLILSQLTNALAANDYILLPSQRLLKIRLVNGKDFPMGNTYYKDLLNGTLGFTKLYETPCGALCNIVYVGSPIFSFEETATVFDRPTVFIFKKTKAYTQQQYQNILEGGVAGKKG